MSDQQIKADSKAEMDQAVQSTEASTQQGSSVQEQVASTTSSTDTDVDRLLQKIKSLEKDNYEYREERRKQKEKEEKERVQSLKEQEKYKELVEDYQNKYSSIEKEHQGYKQKVEQYEGLISSLAENKLKTLTPEQQKQFAYLFGENLQPHDQLEKLDKFLTLPQNQKNNQIVYGAPAKQGSKGELDTFLREAIDNKEARQTLNKGENFVKALSKRLFD